MKKENPQSSIPPPVKNLLITVTFLTIFFLIEIGTLSARDGVEKTSILVLHSYHKGYLWTDDITRGINQFFLENSFPVNVQYEYMDSKKVFDETYLKLIADLYKYKFRNKKFDVIISSDDNAFNFLRDYRDQLFPDTPVVFCGTNYITPERKATLPNSTGINEAASLKGNLELILRLHPKPSHLLVLADKTTTGIRIEQRIDEIKSDFDHQTNIQFLNDLTKDQLVSKLKNLPQSAVVLYTVFSRDSSGNFLEYDESIELVTATCSCPVYITWDFSIGTGAIGGLLTSGFSQGETAAQLALQILKGTPPESIPFIQESPNKYIFDYNSLDKFGIKSSLLPPNSLFRNQPNELYKKYKGLILKSVSGTVLLLLIIVFLMVNLQRRREAETLLSRANEELEVRVEQRTRTLASVNKELTELNAELSDSEERYRSLSNAAFEGILLSSNGIIIEVNKPFCTMMNCEPSEILGKEVLDLVPAMEKEKIKRKVLSGYEEPYETQLQKTDGTIFPAEVSAKMFNYKNQHVRVASIRDLTEKLKAEEEIEALKGIIPICMHCKGIRDDKGYWNKLENYISKRSEATFSHSICDDCLDKYYPDEEE